MFRRLRNRIGQEMFWFSQKHLAKACFIHINKCGGTSIEAALGIPKVHDTAQSRRARVGDAAWRRMFTFSVVRHPFPKVVSHYNYRVKQNYTGLGERPLTLNEWVQESYGRKNPDYFDIPLMFAPCLEWLTDTDGTIMVDEVVKLEDLSAEWPRLAEADRGARGPAAQQPDPRHGPRRGQ